MREGQYNDPKNPVEKRAKIVNILCTFVPKGKVEKNCPAFSSLGKPGMQYIENKLDTIKFTIACHEYYNAGLDYELIIVDNGSEDEETKAYLQSLPYRVYYRENTGFSFGAFKWAWEKFRRKYDYYLFTEQDGVPAKHGWLRELLYTFHGEPNVGAVGNYVESRHLSESSEFFKAMGKQHPTLKDRDWMCNFDGFMTFTSSTILEECGDIFIFPVVGDSGHATWNELTFQQAILECGYKLVSFYDGKHILWKGQYILDHSKEFDGLTQLAPMVLAHPRQFDALAKSHFSWYET